MIKTLLSVLLLSVSVAASAASPSDVRFDQGVDVKAVMHEAGLDRPAAVRPAGVQRHLYWMQGCEKKEMAPGVNETGKFLLSSFEMVEDCEYGYPGGGCRTGIGMSYTRQLRLVLEGRPASNPAESFTVCLTGNDVSIMLMQTPTHYDVSVVGDDVILKARP